MHRHRVARSRGDTVTSVAIPDLLGDQYGDFETLYRGSGTFYVAGIQPPVLTSLLCRVDGMVLPNIYGGA